MYAGTVRWPDPASMSVDWSLPVRGQIQCPVWGSALEISQDVRNAISGLLKLVYKIVKVHSTIIHTFSTNFFSEHAGELHIFSYTD